MKKIFNFTKKKKGFSPNTSDTASVLSLGYDLKEKDLVKVHKAAYGGDLAKLKQLAKKNDINQLDKDNRTALHVACVNGHTDVVQFLVESKAKLNLCDNQNRSPLMKAVQCQQERCVATLLEHDADPNLVDVNGNTALHLASCIPSITTAMLLLENDATINAQNKEGYSPLTMAVKENHADMTEFLLKEGADINIKDLGNRTPLMIAACNGQISLVRLLLQYDADITSKDNNGWSSDDYAVMNGHHACSHLIIEHGAKRKSMRSPAHAPTRKSQASMLASSSQEAGFSLGGPATDKEEQGAIRAGQDVEDNSQTESMSRASKSVADDSWPSSDEDDELHIALKKHPKPNLKKLMNISKKQNDAVPVTDLDESEHESEDRVQRNQPCPQAFLPRCAPQHVVSPISAASFTFKPPQMTSSPFQSSIKEKYSTEDDEEYEEKDEGGDENEQEKSYIEELVDGNMKHQTEENNNPLVDALIPGSENASTEKQRDFLSELGLEKEDEEDSWDTESGSGSPRKQNARAPPKGPVCIISEKNEVLRHDDADRDDVLETEVKGMSGKQLTSSILSKLEMSIEDTEKKTDALDWDRLSTTSKRNLPGCRPPPSIDSELKGEATFPPISAVILADVQAPESSDPDIIALADSSRPEEISSPHSPLPLASQHFLVSQTWPHAQKMLPQCGECEEDSDWDSDHVTTSTSSPVRLKKQLPNITKSTAMLKPHNLLCGPSPFKQEGETSPEPKKQPQEEKDFVLGPAELYVSNSYHPGPVWSDACQKTDGEGGGKENKKEPGWEKHYENIWVEVEKRDVKSIYKNVAGELKEMFGEVSAEFLHETTGEEIKQNVEATTRNTEAESSDKEEVGELIVHPLARAGCIRNTVILTISEQKEVGVKDPLPESADISHFEDRFQPGDTPGSSHLAPMDNDNEMRNQEIHFVKESENGLLPQLSGGFNGERGKFDMEDISKTLKDDNVTSVKFKSSSLEFESSWSEGITHRSQNKRTTTRTQTDTGEARQGPVQNVDDGKDNSIAEEPKMLPPQFLTPPASSAQIPAPSLHSDEKLEEDVQRFKHEVGMLKILFLDLENEKALLQKEVGESQIKMEVLQKSRASWDAEGTRSNQSEHKLDVEEEEKPYTTSENPKESCRSEATETQSRLRAGDSINQRQWSKNLKSADRALEDQQQQQQQQQERRAVTNKATLKLPSLGGAKHGQAPQAVNHVNGQDPLSVFDDSTLSDVSDDDRRHPSKELQKDKPQNSGGVEMMEDFDDLTQSSDTATSDLEDPTSIYRQASFLMKQHDFSSLDSVSMVKLQNMFQEYERTIQREKSRQGRLVDKMRQLEAERAELRGSLEEVRDIKQALDHRQLELDTDLNNLKFQLKQEQEKHRNASMLYDKTRETLRKKEEELRLEVEGKHEVELAKRNQELKMRAILNKMKQLEEDRSETKKLLNQERSARALSETILNNHLRKQQDIVEENRKAICKSNEALSQLTEATDRERELLQQNSVLQADVSSLRAELEHFHSHSSQKESRLSEESEALRERLEDARRDLKLNEEALAQTVYQYTSQLTNLKAELVVKSSRLEHEHQTREQLEVEGESARTRLSSALQEAERCQAALAEAERALQREREEHQRSQDRLIGESANNRLAIDGLSQKLSKAESCANSFENEVHRITMTLTETEHVVTALQRDKELAGGRVRELEAALLAEREQAGRACARQEALQERLAGAQSEAMLLRQQLEEAHNKGTAKEKAVTDAQERFGDLLAKLRSDGEEHVQLVEERSKELAIKAADLRDQVYKLEEEKNERETSFRQLQQELADSLKMLSMSEASLEVNTRYRNDLEEEKARLLKERDRLKGKVEEREEEYVQAQRNINALKSNLAEKDRVVVAASQKLQEVSSALAGSDTIKKQLEEAVQRLEIENARLEAAAKQQTNKIEALQKQIQDAAIVRNRLEDLVTGLQGSKMTLEEQLGREVQKQGMLSHNAQDSHILWEEELKSRSMLGLRLAELEKEKAELSSQMDLEKKKAKKIAGQKKSVDSRLDEEIKRNTDLQKEMYRLRTLVKTAKKKLREQEGAVTEFGSPMRGEMGDRLTEAAISRMKDKVNDLTMQLEKETLRCSQLETLNCDLKEQLSSLKFLSRSNERLERSKRQLEEEVLGLRQKVEAGLMDQSQADQYRRDAEDRARQEINRKLEEVNTFLQTQAASQEVLEQMTAANEASLRLNLEQRIRELEVELNRVRSTQHESMNLRDSDHNELGRYRELYVEEMHRRKSLAAKLERCNERLVEANSKLLNERHRSKSLIASSIVNGTLGGPSLLEMGSLGSVGAYGTTLGPINRSMGGPLLNSLGDMGQSTSVEAYLAKQQNELERTISKAVDYATAELEGSTRVSPIGSASISPTSLGIAVTLEKDPVSRTAQQYLEVLKKNYKI